MLKSLAKCYALGLSITLLALLITYPLMHYEFLTRGQIILGWMFLSLFPTIFLIIFEMGRPDA